MPNLNKLKKDSIQLRIIDRLWGKTIGFNLSVEELANFIRYKILKEKENANHR